MESKKNILENNPFLIEANNDNIKYLTSQFNSFSVSNYSENSTNDLKVFFGRLIYQLQKFETNLDDKIQKYVSNLKEDSKPKENLVKFPSLSAKLLPPNSTIFDVFQKKFGLSTISGNSDFESHYLVNSQQKPKKTKPLSQNHKSRQRINQKIYHPLKILSKDARNDPFADLPPLSEKEIQRGLSNLITNGIIPKDLDLAPAFEKNHPLKTFLVKPKEKIGTIKKKINFSNIIKDDTLNLHLDTKTFLTEKPIAIEDSIQSSLPVNYSQLKINRALEKKVILWKKLKLSIKKGQFVESDPAFQFFKKYNTQNWSFIVQVMKKLEKLLEEHDIRYADIKAEQILLVAKLPNKIEKTHLVSCILNQEIIKSSMKLPTKKFTGIKAEENAVRFLQVFWKSLRLLRRKKKVVLQNKLAKRIQQTWRIYKLYKNTKQTIKSNFNDFVDDYADLLKKFKKQWPDIKGIERVEIHLNSFSYSEMQRLTIENFLQRANMQIARIFACIDPFVEVIYISPIEMDDEIINYYSKVIEIGDLINFKEKVHFLYPEGSKFLPYTFSTSKKLLFSPQALKKIKKIIGLRPAYIITGYPGENDLNIARYLKIPCFCGNPIKAAEFSRKTGSRELFLKSQLPIPPSSSCFKNEEEFLNELVILLYENQNITTWLFKINHEFGGRGVASFTIDTLRLINGLKISKHYNGMPEQVSELRSIIKNLVPIKTVMSSPFLYRSYREFLEELLKNGGVIEGTPPSIKLESVVPTSISLFIEPSGEFHIKATYEKLCGPEFRNIGYLMPNRNTNSFNLSSICNPIVENLLKEDVFGYVTIDLLIFPDPQLKSSHPLFWLIGLDCYMNDFEAILYYFEFLVKGKSDPFSGRYFNDSMKNIQENNILESNDEDKTQLLVEKFMVYCPSIVHPGLAELKFRDFFHKCRMEMILFDLEKKNGASFLLIDSMKEYFLSLIGIGDSWRIAVKNMTDTLNFLIQYVGPTINPKFEKKQKDIRHDSIPLSDIINKIRVLNKNLEKEIEKKNTGRKSMF